MVDAETSAVVLKLKVERAKLIERWEKSAGRTWLDVDATRMCEVFVRILPSQARYVIPDGRVIEAFQILNGSLYVPLEILDYHEYGNLRLSVSGGLRAVYLPGDLKLLFVWPVPSNYADVVLRMERRVARW